MLVVLLLTTARAAAAQEEPEPLNVYYGEIPQAENVFFVALDGDDANAGTQEEPFASITHAIGQVSRGDVIVMRGGIYEFANTISIQTPSGFIDEMITLMAYPGEVPILDFSSQPKERNHHGIRLNANFWHVIGITIRNASHNGIRMDGSYNILEQVTAYGNHDSGIHMAGGASNNLIKNSDSFHNFNYDTSRTPRIGNNADGFSAKFESLGPGNRYEGCRAWENSDDGFDFWMAPETIVIENTWAFGNGDADALGYEGSDFEGNGNGFKLGGNYVHTPHVVRRSMAFNNFGSSGNAKGFDYNNNWGAMTLEHNTAFNNGRNYVFVGDPPEGQPVYINNLSVAPATNHALIFPGGVEAGNSWQHEEEATEEMFLSVDTEAAKGPRQEDGSLPDIDLLKPVPETFIVDGGVAFGLPFYGDAPDIGARPYVTGELVDPWIEVGSAGLIADLRVFDMEIGGLWTIEDDLETGGDVYSQGDAVVESFSDDLRIDQWIRPTAGTAVKNYLFTVADFEVTQNTSLLIAHADEIVDKPSWLSDFEATGAAIVLSLNDEQRTLTVYQRDVEAGETIVLGRNSIDGAPDAPMYLAMLGAVTPVSAEETPLHAVEATLHPNYPNPFSGATTVSYTLAQPGHVTITVSDAIGREVAVLVDGPQVSGRHDIRWEAGALSSGVYLVRLETAGARDVRRMVLVR